MHLSAVATGEASHSKLASGSLSALSESLAAQEASLPLFAGENVLLNPHLEALGRLMELLDPDLRDAMVAAHERDGMGASPFAFAHEWLLLLGKRQLVPAQARYAYRLSPSWLLKGCLLL